jgi:hypothetical protein
MSVFYAEVVILLAILAAASFGFGYIYGVAWSNRRSRRALHALTEGQSRVGSDSLRS